MKGALAQQIFTANGAVDFLGRTRWRFDDGDSDSDSDAPACGKWIAHL